MLAYFLYTTYAYRVKKAWLIPVAYVLFQISFLEIQIFHEEAAIVYHHQLRYHPPIYNPLLALYKFEDHLELKEEGNYLKKNVKNTVVEGF